jgi:hypothetical protein
VRSALVRTAARSDPASGSLLLGVGAVGQEGGAGQVDADTTDELGGPGPGQLLLDDEVLARSEPAPAVGGGPCHAHPPRRGQVRLPAPPEGDLLAQVGEAGREADAVLPGKVLAEPGAELSAEVFLVRRGRQVHGAGPA